VRDEFLHALQVAAAVDKHVGLPERKILRRAAHHLERPFDVAELEKMMLEFEEFGVLRATKRAPHTPPPEPPPKRPSRAPKSKKGKANGR
jgi:hypothetical protein